MKEKVSYGLALLSGALLLLSFPPFNFWSLAWVALVPLLIVLHYQEDWKRMHKLGMAFGLPLILIGIWMYSEFGFFLPWFIAWILGIIVAIFIGTGWFPEIVKSWKPKDYPSRQLSFLPSTSKILTMPIIWTTTVFLAYNLPVIMKVGGALGY